MSRTLTSALVAIALVALTALWALGPGAPVALAAVAPGSPLAAFANGGEDVVLYRGSNGDLWENTLTAAGWQAPADTGVGPLGSAPAVTAGPHASEYAFWRSTDGALWWGYYTPANGVWNGPMTTNSGQLGSVPTALAAAGPDGRVSVFWQGSGGNRDIWWDSSTEGPMGAFELTNIGKGRARRRAARAIGLRASLLGGDRRRAVDGSLHVGQPELERPHPG